MTKLKPSVSQPQRNSRAMNRQISYATAAVILIGLPLSAQAQTRARTTGAARPAAASTTPARPLALGPEIPGMCIFFQNRGVGSSIVGGAFDARMQQLRSQAAAELSGEQSQLRADVQAFQTRRASLTQEQQQQQAAPLQQRGDALSQKAQQRNAELEYTFRHQLSRIAQALDPIIQTVYQDRHCSILLNGDSEVMAANPTMDITPAVISQLNQRMTTIAFDRESPPASAQ